MSEWHHKASRNIHKSIEIKWEYIICKVKWHLWEVFIVLSIFDQERHSFSQISLYINISKHEYNFSICFYFSLFFLFILVPPPFPCSYFCCAFFLGTHKIRLSLIIARSMRKDTVKTDKNFLKAANTHRKTVESFWSPIEESLGYDLKLIQTYLFLYSQISAQYPGISI